MTTFYPHQHNQRAATDDTQVAKASRQPEYEDGPWVSSGRLSMSYKWPKPASSFVRLNVSSKRHLPLQALTSDCQLCVRPGSNEVL